MKEAENYQRLELTADNYHRLASCIDATVSKLCEKYEGVGN